MKSLLVAVDGSEHAANAIRYVIANLPQFRQQPEIHIVNVQAPILSGAVTMFISADQLRDYYHDQATEALKPARELLDQAGVAYQHHIGVGEPGEIIMRFANQLGCEQIVMGSRGLGALPNLVLGSVATKVLHLADRPVLIVR